MSRWLACLLPMLIAANACDSVGSGSKKRPAPEKQEQLARGYAADRERDLATIRRFQDWQGRIRAIDLAAEGLPPIPDAAATDDFMNFQPVAGTLEFCERLPPQLKPAPDALVREFRDHGRRYGEARSRKHSRTIRLTTWPRDTWLASHASRVLRDRTMYTRFSDS